MMFMKNTNFTIFIISILAFGLLFNMAANADPGAETDPLVSRSYVDQKINEVMKALNAANGAPAAQDMQPVVGGLSFSPVLVETGKTIYGGEGCEMIMRSGNGHIVTSTDGVVNVTTGGDLKNGAPAPLNSLLIISRDDGRGVKVTGDTWFLVKGSYTIG